MKEQWHEPKLPCWYDLGANPEVPYGSTPVTVCGSAA